MRDPHGMSDTVYRMRGRMLLAPHFHMKLKSGFKDDTDTAIEEIKAVIDNYVTAIDGVLGE